MSLTQVYLKWLQRQHAVSDEVHRQVGKSLDQRKLRESRLRAQEKLERNWKQEKHPARR